MKGLLETEQSAKDSPRRSGNLSTTTPPGPDWSATSKIAGHAWLKNTRDDLVFNAATTKRGAAERTIFELQEVGANVVGCALFGVEAMKGGYFRQQFKAYRKYLKGNWRPLRVTRMPGVVEKGVSILRLGQ
jgi:hypothetical protein